MTGRELSASYERPVEGRLVVRLANGEEWAATDEDLARFGFGRKLDLYTRVIAVLTEGLGLEPGTDLTRHEPEGPNLVRYVIECGLMYDHTPWADEHGRPWPREDDEGEPEFRERLQAVFRGSVEDVTKDREVD